MDVTSFRKELRILSVTELIKVENLKFGYRYDKKLLPNPLVSNIELDHAETKLVKQHKYNTRNRNLPNLPTATNNKYKNSFLFNSMKSYSDLPAPTRDASSLQSFVSKIKAKIFES